MVSNKKIICLIGASGCGKSTVADILINEYGLKQVQSYTTRPKRHDNDSDHIYINDDQFSNLKSIIAYTVFDGYRYCATKEQYDNSDLYVIDPIGFINMMLIIDKHEWGYKQPYVVYLTADKEIRKNRMKKRGDSDEKIQHRLSSDEHVFNDTIINSIIDDGYPFMSLSSNSKTPHEIADIIYNEIYMNMEEKIN